MRHVGVGRLHAGDAFRGGEEAEEADVGGAGLLEQRHGGDGGVAGGEHRVERDGDALVEVGRDLGVVLHRLQRGLVAVEADEADARRGDELEHAVEQAVAGAQDRDERELLALEDRGLHLGQRRLDRLASSSAGRG